MQFRLSHAAIYPCSYTSNIGPTYCTSRGCGKPVHLSAERSRIHREYNEHIGCYIFHSDMRLTIRSSELPTSFRYHLPLLFPTTKWWIHNHLSQVRAHSNQANCQAFYQIRHPSTGSKNTGTSESTVILRRQLSNIWPQMWIYIMSVIVEAVRNRNSMQ